MSEAFAQQLALLPAYLGAHLTISLVGLVAGVLLSLPLAVFIAKYDRLRWPVLAVVGAIQTIPSLALLALMVPLLNSFGFAPTVAALTLYSMLPVLRNTVTGITGVDAGVVEAARGMGMTERQLLWRIELPLAAPVILAGIRTAAVWVVGIATLSTPIGQTSLGNYIFAGLQTRRWDVVLLGCAAATALALLVDGIIALAERGMQPGRRALVGAAAVCLILLGLLGAIAPRSGVDWFVPADDTTAGAKSVAKRDEESTVRLEVVRVGAKSFTEQYILAALVADELSASGYRIESVDSLGSTVAFEALRRDEIQVYVDYTGTIWANHLRRQDTPEPWQVTSLVASHLAENDGIRLLCSLGFENAYTFAMRRERAAAFGIRSLVDLARLAPQLVVGSDYEFFSRPEWTKVSATYGLRFGEVRTFDSTFMYEAVARNEVDLITAFSSDGRLDSFDLVVLDDPLAAFPPYHAVILLSPRAAADANIARSLTSLCESIPVALMRGANALVDRDTDKRTPQQAAVWLRERLH